MSDSQVTADAALARALADQEGRAARIEEADSRRREWDAFHYSRQYPYYYGTWRNPGYRPVMVYRERDQCTGIPLDSFSLYYA